MLEKREINTMEDCLLLMGSENPFRKQNPKNVCDDCLTESGYVAYDQLRELLSFLSREGVISGFDEDVLDKYIDFNY